MNLKRGLTVLTIILILMSSSATYAFASGETQQGISLLDAVEQEKNTEAEEALQEILIATNLIIHMQTLSLVEFHNGLES